MDILGLIGFSVFLLLMILLVIGNIRLRISAKKREAVIDQLHADKLMLLGKVSQLFDELNIKELENTNGFIGFLEKSRDSAFEYIEIVQKKLSDFDKKISPIIEWNKTFGTVMGENVHQDQLTKISEAYQDLKNLLPEENKQGEINE